MNDIIVQEFNLRIEGKGLFAVYTSSGETMVPTFGYDKTGKVMSRRVAEKIGYAPLRQEWIDKQIILSAENFRQSENIKDAPVYIAVIKRSDVPNEIGMVMDSSSMSLENSSVSVEKQEYKLKNKNAYTI